MPRPGLCLAGGHLPCQLTAEWAQQPHAGGGVGEWGGGRWQAPAVGGRVCCQRLAARHHQNTVCVFVSRWELSKDKRRRQMKHCVYARACQGCVPAVPAACMALHIAIYIVIYDRASVQLALPA